MPFDFWPSQVCATETHFCLGCNLVVPFFLALFYSASESLALEVFLVSYCNVLIIAVE